VWGAPGARPPHSSFVPVHGAHLRRRRLSRAEGREGCGQEWLLDNRDRRTLADRRRIRSPPQALDRRTHLCLAQPFPATGTRFRALRQNRRRLHPPRHDPPVHIDKPIPRRKNYDNRTALAEEEEQILKCLGAAVLMRWNTLPTKLQRELFDCASTIGDLQQTTP